MTSRGRLFQRRLPATGNTRSPVDSRVRRTLAARMTTTTDRDDWSRRHARCSRTDTVAPARVQTSIDEHGQFEINALTTPQPVKVPEHWCDVIVPRRSMYQSGGGIEHRLKSTKLGYRKPSKCSVSIVETWHNRRMEHQSQTLNV